ncbi:glycosyltransferase family 2 protein [bacterium]|nr:glycosyltransferase family 2 protein [bacterium]
MNQPTAGPTAELAATHKLPDPSGRMLRSVSVVIPCLNEMEVLFKLFDRLEKEIAHWCENYEVILVDDGSTDETWSIIQNIHARNPRWKGIRLGRNFGHQLALRAGLQASSGDVVAVLDADLQDPPEVAGQMIGQWKEGFDVVVGVRRHRKEGPLKRSLYFSFYRLLSLIAELDLPLDAGDFCVMDRQVVDVIVQMPESRPFIRGLRSWVGFRQSLFPYERAARQAGQTKYSYWKLMKLAADGVLSNSRIPLHFATVFGALVSVIAFLGAVLTLAIRMAPATFKQWGVEYVPGTASVIISLLFIGGVQLFCMGIIGAYVGRIHENVMRRPLWSVRQTLGVERDRLT